MLSVIEKTLPSLREKPQSKIDFVEPAFPACAGMTCKAFRFHPRCSRLNIDCCILFIEYFSLCYFVPLCLCGSGKLF